MVKKKIHRIKKGLTSMSEKFIKAEEVAQLLEVSVPYAYKVIRKLNQELADKGYLTVSGRVSRQYFNERMYNGSAQKKEVNA